MAGRPVGALLLLLFNLLPCVCGDFNYQAATDLLGAIVKHFHSQCVFVLHKENGLQLDIHRQWLTKHMERTLSSDEILLAVVNFETFIYDRPNVQCNNRPLYFLASSDEDNKNFLTELSDSNVWGLTGPEQDLENSTRAAPRNPVWLMYLQSTPLTTFFADIYIPFDCQLIVAQRYEKVTRLREVYKVAEGLPTRDHDFGNYWNKKLTVVRKSFYDKRNSLEGLVLKAVSVESVPFTHIGKDERGKLEVQGYVGNVWKALQKKLNFTTMYNILPPGMKFETLNIVANKQAHVALMDYTITKSRFKYVDFSSPILHTSYRVFIEHPGYQYLKWTSYLDPFETELWMTELLTIVILALILSLFYYLGRKFGSPDIEDEGTYTFYNSIFYMVGAFFMQGHDITPKSCACRVVYLVAYLTAIILMAAYSAALISFLAVQTSAIPFQGVEGMLADKSYHFGVTPNTSAHHFIKESQDDTINKLVDSTKKYTHEWPSSYLEGFKKVCESKFAYMAPLDYAIMFNKEVPCALTSLPGFQLRVSMSFVIVKNSPYRGILNYNINRMLKSGALQKLLNDARPSRLPDVPGTLTNVSLGDVAPILVALAMGVVIAMLFLAGEKLINRLLSKSSGSMIVFVKSSLSQNSQPRSTA